MGLINDMLIKSLLSNYWNREVEEVLLNVLTIIICTRQNGLQRLENCIIKLLEYDKYKK